MRQQLFALSERPFISAAGASILILAAAAIPSGLGRLDMVPLWVFIRQVIAFIFGVAVVVYSAGQIKRGKVKGWWFTAFCTAFILCLTLFWEIVEYKLIAGGN